MKGPFGRTVAWRTQSWRSGRASGADSAVQDDDDDDEGDGEAVGSKEAARSGEAAATQGLLHRAHNERSWWGTQRTSRHCSERAGARRGGRVDLDESPTANFRPPFSGRHSPPTPCLHAHYTRPQGRRILVEELRGEVAMPRELITIQVGQCGNQVGRPDEPGTPSPPQTRQGTDLRLRVCFACCFAGRMALLGPCPARTRGGS